MDQEEPEIHPSGMACPNCYSRNPASVSFCTHCGQPTRPENGGCSSCLAELPKVLGDTDYSPQQELTEDILAILHTFSCRLHGLRRYRNAIQADTGLSDSSAATDAETLV